MKIVTLFTVMAMALTLNTFGQCPSSFTFAINSETVSFTNQSTISNAHYFWNFGDGTGSNIINPVHHFPENGKYMVTLFVRDTVTNCSSYYEQWLSVMKSSTITCQPGFEDTVLYGNQYVNVYLQLTDTSVNCNSYTKYIDGGYSQNQPGYMWAYLDVYPGRYVGRIRYYNGSSGRAAYKTVPFRYSSAKNYNNCSANFEFKIVSQSSMGQRILYTAMNKNATSYKWYLPGITTTVIPTTDTVSVYYPYSTYSNSILLAVLFAGSSTCSGDTLLQNIRIPDMSALMTGVHENRMDKPILSIYPNPTPDKLIIASTFEIEKMTLTNSLGQDIFSIDNPQREQEINIAQLPAGIYFIQARSKDGQSVSKVMKQ